jgi:hypothetical protein
MSPSLSPSISPSLSPSASESPSLSPSASVSPSPSPGWRDYTRGDEDILPTNDNDLETLYSVPEIDKLSLEDGQRVCQTASNEYAIHQYKDYVNQAAATFRWTGQSSIPCATSTVYLQIYKRTTNEWETIDFDDATLADTNIDLIGVVADLTNYKDYNNVVSCRIYQEAKA